MIEQSYNSGTPARLSGSASYWVNGGPISRWMPVHSRFGRMIATGPTRAYFVLTRAVAPPVEPVVTRWLAHQQLLVVPPENHVTPRTGELVFSRLAVKQRAVALHAVPSLDYHAAVDQTRAAIENVDELTVWFGLIPGRLIPDWVICHDHVPVFVSLPDIHLVATKNAFSSLATLVAGARVKQQIHEVTTLPRPRPATELAKGRPLGA